MYDLRDPNYVPPHLRVCPVADTPAQAASPAPSAPVMPGGTGDAKPAPDWVAPGWATRGQRGPGEKHPWRATPPGGTFRIEPGASAPKLASVRATCSYKGKELGCKFRCHQYADGTIEVWRQN